MAVSRSSDSLLIPQLVLLLLFTGFTMNMQSTQLMIWNKTCLNNGYDKDICDHMTQHPEVEDEIQGKAVPVNMRQTLLSFVPAAFMTLVWGSLSDVVGRKVILMLPAAAGVISAASMLFQSLQTTLSPGLLYSTSLMVGFSGGLGTFMSTMISYVMDGSSKDQRTAKMGKLMPAIPLGQTIGSLCSGFLYEQFGASTIYLLLVLSNIAIFVMLFYLKEAAKTNTSGGDKDHGVLSLGGLWHNVTAGVRVLAAVRENGRRRKLLLVLVAGAAGMTFATAAATLSGLHVRRVPFQWTPSTFSFFTAICKVSGVIGMITLVPMFQKVLGSKSQQSDLTLTGIGFGFIALECLALFVASSSYHLIVVPLFASLQTPIAPATRSLASKLVLPAEIGALNGITSFINSISATIGVVSLMALYRNTTQTMPGVAFLIMFVGAIFTVFLLMLTKNIYHALPESDENKNITLPESADGKKGT